MKKIGRCRRCAKDTTFAMHVQYCGNNTRHFVWVCLACGLLNPDGIKLYVPHEEVITKITEAEVDLLPTIAPFQTPRCARCGERQAELHHWAPRALFPETHEDWPQDYLCKACHYTWHRMVTPQLCQGGTVNERRDIPSAEDC